MQKKLYFLNEEEKNRILNLHETRTKKQYLLNEQTEVCPNQLPMDRVESDIRNLSDIFKNMEKAFVRMFYQKERVVEIYNTIKKLSSKNVYDEMNQKCHNALQYTIDNFQEFDQVGRFISYGKTLDQYLREFTKKGSYQDRPELQRYLQMSLEIVTNLNSIKTPSESTKTTTTADAPTIPTEWTGPKCIWKYKIKYDKDNNFIKSGPYYFFNDGTYADLKTPDKTLGTYECDRVGKLKYIKGDISSQKTDQGKTKTDVSKAQVSKTITPVTGVGRVTKSVQEKVPDILSKAGLKDTQITQDSVNKLFDILSKKS